MKRLEVKLLGVEENPIGKDGINLKGELSKTEISSSFGVKQSKSTSWGQCKYKHFLQQTNGLSASSTFFPVLLVEKLTGKSVFQAIIKIQNSLGS